MCLTPMSTVAEDLMGIRRLAGRRFTRRNLRRRVRRRIVMRTMIRPVFSPATPPITSSAFAPAGKILEI